MIAHIGGQRFRLLFCKGFGNQRSSAFWHMLFTALSAVALSAGARGPSAARARQCGMASVSGLIYAADEANDDQALPTPPPPPPGRRLTWPRGTHMMAGADLARGAAVRRTRRILLSQEGRPAVRLFTKEGCTLCEAAKEVPAACGSSGPPSFRVLCVKRGPDT